MVARTCGILAYTCQIRALELSGEVNFLEEICAGMLITLGFRHFSFTGTFKQKAFLHRMYECRWKNKISSRVLYNTLYVLSSNKAVNRLVLVPLSACSGSSNLKTQYYSFPLGTLKLNQGVSGYVVWIALLIRNCFQIIGRCIQLACTFTPLLLLYPLTMTSSKLKSIWYRMLLFGIEISGPIIIKLGQWASTRRDLFSAELCIYLSKLQRKTTPHSWYYTKKCFENAYGPQWQDIFDEFDNEPIGSGCCAQVYKAWVRKEKIPTIFCNYEGYRPDNLLVNEVREILGGGYFHGYSRKTDMQHNTDDLIPVAVKVQHPHMERRLRQDLSILKFLASATTYLIPSLKWLSLCECVDDFSQVMQSQVNFYTEAENLKLFAMNFKNLNTIKFPHPLEPLTRFNILVETFEEGRHIHDFLDVGEKDGERKWLALTGVNTILKMVFEDNFVHGDLHPGNLLVQEKDSIERSSKVSFLPWLKSKKEPLTLVILDCGIVATLDERGKTCLKDVFTAVAKADGERVAELFLQHSNHECNNIQSFKNKMNEIVRHALNKCVTLHQVDVSVLMNSLFSTMIHHKVKVDSSFSSVILAIMVLEGLGRSLDPTIDIMESAKPFLFSRAL